MLVGAYCIRPMLYCGRIQYAPTRAGYVISRFFN